MFLDRWDLLMKTNLVDLDMHISQENFAVMYHGG